MLIKEALGDILKPKSNEEIKQGSRIEQQIC